MGQIPYGYRIEKRCCCDYTGRGSTDRLIFQNYIAGMSLQSAARAAGHPMAHSTVRRMLQRKMLPWRCFLSGNSGQKKHMLGQMQSGSIVQM